MTPRRRASDHAPFGLTKERVEALALSALVALCSVLWTSNAKQASTEERIAASAEFRQQQIHSRDREIDDLRTRVRALEGRCQ